MKKFEMPELEIVKFAAADILTTSSVCYYDSLEEDELPMFPIG